MGVPSVLENKPSRIIRSLRKYHGITQTNFCQELNLTQGTLSKIEHGLLECSASLWFNITQYFNVDPLPAFQNGLVDHGLGPDKEQSFHSKYRGNLNRLADSSNAVRQLRPLLMMLDSRNEINFLDQLEIDSDYFFVLDNKIDSKFYTDFIQVLINNKALKKSILDKYLQEFQSTVSFDQPHVSFGNESVFTTQLKECLRQFTLDWNLEWLNTGKKSKRLNLLGSDRVRMESHFWKKDIFDFSNYYFMGMLKSIISQLSNSDQFTICPADGRDLEKNKQGMSYNLEFFPA